MEGLALRALAILAVLAVAFSTGWHFGGQEAEADLVDYKLKQAQATAEVARLATVASEKARESEQKQGTVMHDIGVHYEQEKIDAASDAYNDALADVRAGRLREYWSCSVPATAEAAAATRERDAQDRLRRESAGRIVATVAACQAQRDALIETVNAYLHQGAP